MFEQRRKKSLGSEKKTFFHFCDFSFFFFQIDSQRRNVNISLEKRKRDPFERKNSLGLISDDLDILGKTRQEAFQMINIGLFSYRTSIEEKQSNYQTRINTQNRLCCSSSRPGPSSSCKRCVDSEKPAPGLDL